MGEGHANVGRSEYGLPHKEDCSRSAVPLRRAMQVGSRANVSPHACSLPEADSVTRSRQYLRITYTHVLLLEIRGLPGTVDLGSRIKAIFFVKDRGERKRERI